MIDDTDYDSFADAVTARRYAHFTELIAMGREMAERLDRNNPALAAMMRKEVAATRRARDRLLLRRRRSTGRPPVGPTPGTTIH